MKMKMEVRREKGDKKDNKKEDEKGTRLKMTSQIKLNVVTPSSRHQSINVES